MIDSRTDHPDLPIIVPADVEEWALIPDDSAPFLITLGFDPATFDRLEGLRQRYFPPGRNQVPAHLSLFHQLPGPEWDAVDAELDRAARSHPPIELRFTAPRPTGRGVMLVVQAPTLVPIHGALARAFDRHLTAQDRQPYRPHVMLMNKAERADADRALHEIQAGFAPWAGTGDRLILWRYLGGPWDEAASYPFLGPVPVAEP